MTVPALGERAVARKDGFVFIPDANTDDDNGQKLAPQSFAPEREASHRNSDKDPDVVEKFAFVGMRAPMVAKAAGVHEHQGSNKGFYGPSISLSELIPHPAKSNEVEYAKNGVAESKARLEAALVITKEF